MLIHLCSKTCQIIIKSYFSRRQKCFFHFGKVMGNSLLGYFFFFLISSREHAFSELLSKKWKTLDLVKLKQIEVITRIKESSGYRLVPVSLHCDHPLWQNLTFFVECQKTSSKFLVKLSHIWTFFADTKNQQRGTLHLRILLSS